MPSLSTYEKECITMREDKEKEGWNMTIKRLSKEWSKIEEDKIELMKDGIYISTKDDFSEFTVMIFKEKDGGPYTFIPLFFTIKPCKNKDGMIYPMSAPIVKFHSFNNKWIHPNLKKTGDVCISLLEYSYIGNGVASWNPALGIKAIAITIASLIEDYAIRKEPSLANESITSKKCIDYDNGVQFLCMNYVLDLYSNEITLYKEELLKSKSKVMQYITDKTEDREDMCIKTYAFEFTTDYKRLYNKAITL
jgi:ubiquitin-protein ligase